MRTSVPATLLALFCCTILVPASGQSDSLQWMLNRLGSDTAVTAGINHGTVKVRSSVRIDSLEKSNRGISRLKGYRIQAFMGTYRDVMEARKKFVETNARMAAYALPNTPDYMLMLGDFRTHWEAQQYLPEARKLYTGAFIVPSVIEPPPFPKTDETR